MAKPEESPNEGVIDYIINNNIEQLKCIVNKSKENIENIIKSMNVNKEELHKVVVRIEKHANLIESKLKRNKDEDKDDMFAIQTIFYNFLIKKWNEMSKQQTAENAEAHVKRVKNIHVKRVNADVLVVVPVIKKYL